MVTWGGAIDEDLKKQPTDDILLKHIKRELAEECNYNGPIRSYKKLVNYKHKAFSYYNFLIIIDSHSFEIKLNWETEKAKWVTFDELDNLAPMHFGLAHVLNDNSSRHILENSSRS